MIRFQTLLYPLLFSFFFKFPHRIFQNICENKLLKGKNLLICHFSWYNVILTLTWIHCSCIILVNHELMQKLFLDNVSILVLKYYSVAHLYSACANQFNNIPILVNMITYFTAKVVSMATKIMWPISDIIIDQNTEYGEDWSWIGKTTVISCAYWIICSVKTVMLP